MNSPNPMSLLLASMGLFPTFEDRQTKQPKNKYNLTPQQVNHLKDLTPKEKKVYLRSLKNKGE